jgi:hypothetical protein
MPATRKRKLADGTVSTTIRIARYVVPHTT